MVDFIINKKHSLQQYLSTRPFAQLAFTIGVMVCFFIILDRWILAVTALPQASYFKPLIAIELIKNLFSSPFKIALAILLAGFIIIQFKRFWIPWSQLELSRYIRPFILLLAVILCWWFVTYDYNLYFNQAHYYDRFLLITLVLFIAWRPFFILPFLLLLTSIIWQFFIPLEKAASWCQPSMPLRLLTMFVATQFFYALTGKQKIIDWLFLGVCIIAAHYWVPGIGKVQLNWISYGHIHNIVQATYANGWLAFLDPLQISAIIRHLAELDWLIRIPVQGLQLGAVIVLWRRFSLLALLTCWTIFHVGIFATTGILFWQWIVIEISIVLLIRALWKNESPSFINRHYFCLSVLLISTSMIWVKPTKLAWYDTPISYTYRFEAIGESGRRYTLPPRFFAPYDFLFTLGSLRYLSPATKLPVTWGASVNREIADKLLQAKTKKTILQIETKYGHNFYDPDKCMVFDDFIRQFILNLNKRGSKSTIFGTIQAPRQLWTFSRGTAYDYQEFISRVNIYQVTSWFDGKEYREIENKTTRRIIISEPL